MNAREYLESFRHSEKKIELKISQVQKLHESLTMLSAPMDKEQVSHSRNVSIMAETVAQIVDMEREIDQQTAELFQKKRHAFALLDKIDPMEASILIEHYIDAKTLKRISEDLFITERHVCRRIHDAISHFQKVLDSEPDEIEEANRFEILSENAS